MLSWTLVFLVVAVIAAVLGFGGIAASAAGIAKILFFIFLVLFVISAVMGANTTRRVDKPFWDTAAAQSSTGPFAFAPVWRPAIT